MLKKILVAFVVIVGVFVVVVATRDAKYHIERSTTIAAPPELVYPWVESAERFTLWSPFQKLDPNMKQTFSGPKQGVGSAFHWVGEGDAGEGSMKLIEARPNESATWALEFVKPIPSQSTITFLTTPDPAGTKVTWADDGEIGFVAK